MRELGHKGFFDIKPHQRGLAGQFLLPPFSVLHTYTGEWKRRKQQWLALGIKGEVGRECRVYTNREWVRKKLPHEKGLCVNLTAGGVSVFDPVLCELMYSWFCPKGGGILDPFAGGSVRGVVASCMGYKYYGCEICPEQVQANREQAVEIFGRYGVDSLTPVQYIIDGVYLKRDDYFNVLGLRGGKVRTAYTLLKKADSNTIVTAGARQSPQIAIVSALSYWLGKTCHCFVPTGEETEMINIARYFKAKVHKVMPGRNSVLISRAVEFAKKREFCYIPFGMECEEAVEETAKQVQNLPFDKINKIVLPVGSGMSLAGVITGLKRLGIKKKVLGIVVGANPERRLDKFAPSWEDYVELIRVGKQYHEEERVDEKWGVHFDKIYEAKCLGFVEKGDLFWVVGMRPKLEEVVGENYPKWIVGDSNKVLDGLIEKGVKYDFIFTCPPYGNLEVYSDLEGDISNIQSYDKFLEAYSSIIHKACHCLRQNRFACFVVANYRDKKGFYHDFVGDTIRAFEECGAHFYNELILVTPPGSLPVRAGRVFSSTRKVGKMHQNVLVFYKGDVKKIKEIFK